MNAVIALCHFCEVHGPSVIFCTQSTRYCGDVQINANEEAACRSCVSLGPYVGFQSKDQDGIDYISTQNSIATEAVSLLKQACVRSLSCEVSQCKDGGVVYFGDLSHGHVLSHTFQVSDAQSRGFYRWFSIIVLMKDKMFLLNLSPFLSEHLQVISKEIQNYARAVYKEEQSHCSQRALRLSTSQSTPPQMRSLPELTHKPHIFAHLHSKFTWLLKAGATYYKERILQIKSTATSPFSYTDTEEGFTIVHLNKISQNVVGDEKLIRIGLRDVKNILGNDIFSSLVFCVLVGKQVIIRGPGEKNLPILNAICHLFPVNHRPAKISVSEMYESVKLAPILALELHVAVPQPCEDIFRIDAVDENYVLKWTGKLPEKLPTLCTKILNAVEDARLSEIALFKQVTALIEEYQSKTMAIKSCVQGNFGSNPDLDPLYKALRIQQHDKLLINYWGERYEHNYKNKRFY